MSYSLSHLIWKQYTHIAISGVCPSDRQNICTGCECLTFSLTISTLKDTWRISSCLTIQCWLRDNEIKCQTWFCLLQYLSMKKDISECSYLLFMFRKITNGGWCHFSFQLWIGYYSLGFMGNVVMKRGTLAYTMSKIRMENTIYPNYFWHVSACVWNQKRDILLMNMFMRQEYVFRVSGWITMHDGYWHKV